MFDFRTSAGHGLSRDEKQALLLALIGVGVLILVLIALLTFALLTFAITAQGPANPVAAATITAIGIFLAPVIPAVFAIVAYGRQKKLDFEHALLARKQQEYEQYLLAFQEANHWKGKDKDKHQEADATYQQKRTSLLLIASPSVMEKVTSFHNYYLDVFSKDRNRSTGSELERRYASMVNTMREECFEIGRLGSLSTEELAKTLPWSVY